MTRRNLTSTAWLTAALLAAALPGVAAAQAPPAPAAAATPPAAALASPTQIPEPPVVPPAAAPATAAPPAAAAPSGPALPPQPPPADVKRGFLNDFGRWWNDSIANFNAKMKEQQSKFDAFNKESNAAAQDAATATQEAMKNAADAWARLPTSRVVEMHEVCPLAGNGAPDCATAATSACRTRGFKTGQPADIRTAEKCTASLWVSGQPPAACPVETMVLRATCQ